MTIQELATAISDAFAGEDGTVCGEIGSNIATAVDTTGLGNFVLQIQAEGDPAAELDPVAEALARWVAERIPEEGSPPDLLALLPTEGRRTDPPVFLHRPLILSGLTFQAVAVEPSTLGLDERCDMVVASYEGRFALSVTRYPEEASAQSAFEAYADASVLVTRVGRYLVATTSASEAARSAFEEAVSRVKARVTE